MSEGEMEIQLVIRQQCEQRLYELRVVFVLGTPEPKSLR
jgi:hypothetical protein